MEIYIATRCVQDQLGQPRKFQYYLTVDTVEVGQLCCETYGVRVAEDGRECVCLSALTPSATRIDQLMTTLVDHAVGPIGLRDVVADWL